ncbi:hypothetical protein H6P81_009513 [Aristolochia fimbriata]|uniref:Vacuolar protein sorting-associated protein 26C n=1 Tax=Aristolochia fimbriata TaxID=158543 RepID=A0AAV7EL89_ARIFI|nr:hypothetical protein H6P81_009513 [Aristolochia fimbriata]
MSIQIKLSRASRVYRPNEHLQGVIVTTSTNSISHQGIRITLNGTVNLQIRAGMAGVIDSFYNVVKPISIINKSSEIQSSGKLGAGTTEIPFSITLSSQQHDGGERFYETYHGANISIQYLLTADMVRGYLHKSLSTTIEVIIESDKAYLAAAPVSPETVSFYITQDTQKHPLLPELLSGGFRVTGKVSTCCSVSNPITGDLVVEASATPIQSIDILLLRTESILAGDKILTDTSVVQTTQVADGDVCRGMTLPIYVIIPRLLMCPTILAGRPFSVEFQLTVVVSFQSELSKRQPKSDLRTPRLWVAMETLPLRLIRTK